MVAPSESPRHWPAKKYQDMIACINLEIREENAQRRRAEARMRNA